MSVPVEEKQSVPLTILALLFGLVSGYCLARVVRSIGSLCKSDKKLNSGLSTRMWFEILLFLGNFARMVCLLIETLQFEDNMCPELWTCVMVRCIPNLFFLSVYSLLVLFFSSVSAYHNDHNHVIDD